MPQEERFTLKKMTFTKSLRGYSCDEVDTYIDYVTDKYAQICREYTEIRRKLTTTVARESELRAEDEQAQKARIEKYQMSCDAMVNEAKRHAARILADAEHEAKLIIRQAEDEAQNIAANAAKEGIRAQYEANRSIAAKSNLADRMIQEIDTFRKEVFALYADHIDALEHLGKMTDDFYQHKNELADAGEAVLAETLIPVGAVAAAAEEDIPEEAEQTVLEEAVAEEIAVDEPEIEVEETEIPELTEPEAEETAEWEEFPTAVEFMEETVEEIVEETVEDTTDSKITDEMFLPEEEYEVWSGQELDAPEEDADAFELPEVFTAFEEFDEIEEPEQAVAAEPEEIADTEEFWEEEPIFTEGELTSLFPEPEQWDDSTENEDIWEPEFPDVPESSEEKIEDTTNSEAEFSDTAELLQALFGKTDWKEVTDTANEDSEIFEMDAVEEDKVYNSAFDMDENDVLLADLKSIYGADDDDADDDIDFDDENGVISFIPTKDKNNRQHKDMDDLLLSGDATNSTKDISLTGEFDIIFSKEKSMRNVEEIGKQPMVAPEAPTKPKKHSRF